MCRSRMRRHLGAALIFCAAFTGLAQAGGPPAAVDDPRLPEISGLAASRRLPERFWVHNDSGNPARLFALDAQGRVQQGLDLQGAQNLDWEDIAAFVHHGEPWLAVADTGDNFAIRAEVEILLLPEPLAASGAVPVARTLRFGYPGGARDLEAMTVDAAAGKILLLEKCRPPAKLYTLDLDGPDRQLAQEVAVLPDWYPEAAAPVETIGERRYRGAATAMDLSPDGRRLAILTNTHWMVFARPPGAGWGAVFAQAPQASGRLPRQGISRRAIFEALGWVDDRELLISGERLPAPLLRIVP